jgi:hypothetical protein
MSLVNKSTKPWKFYMGIPAKAMIDRPKNIVEIAEQFLKEYGN